MVDIILILILILAVGGAAYYIYKAKKGGRKCIGCPYADACAKNCDCESDK